MPIIHGEKKTSRRQSGPLGAKISGQPLVYSRWIGRRAQFDQGFRKVVVPTFYPTVPGLKNRIGRYPLIFIIHGGFWAKILVNPGDQKGAISAKSLFTFHFD